MIGKVPSKGRIIAVEAGLKPRAKTTLGMFGGRTVEETGQLYKKLIDQAKGEKTRPRGWFMQKLFGQTEDATRIQNAKSNLVREITQNHISIPKDLQEALMRKTGLNKLEADSLLEILSTRIKRDSQLIKASEKPKEGTAVEVPKEKSDIIGIATREIVEMESNGIGRASKQEISPQKSLFERDVEKSKEARSNPLESRSDAEVHSLADELAEFQSEIQNEKGLPSESSESPLSAASSEIIIDPREVEEEREEEVDDSPSALKDTGKPKILEKTSEQMRVEQEEAEKRKAEFQARIEKFDSLAANNAKLKAEAENRKTAEEQAEKARAAKQVEKPAKLKETEAAEKSSEPKPRKPYDQLFQEERMWAKTATYQQLIDRANRWSPNSVHFKFDPSKRFGPRGSVIHAYPADEGSQNIASVLNYRWLTRGKWNRDEMSNIETAILAIEEGRDHSIQQIQAKHKRGELQQADSSLPGLQSLEEEITYDADRILAPLKAYQLEKTIAWAGTASSQDLIDKVLASPDNETFASQIKIDPSISEILKDPTVENIDRAIEKVQAARKASIAIVKALDNSITFTSETEKLKLERQINNDADRVLMLLNAYKEKLQE